MITQGDVQVCVVVIATVRKQNDEIVHILAQPGDISNVCCSSSCRIVSYRPLYGTLTSSTQVTAFEFLVLK